LEDGLDQLNFNLTSNTALNKTGNIEEDKLNDEMDVKKPIMALNAAKLQSGNKRLSVRNSRQGSMHNYNQHSTPG